jgi:hypothetical protein
MNRQKKLLEVFIERDCPSCEEVIGVVNRYRHDPWVDLQIYVREKNASIFRERRVVICPATFVDQRLLFYGAFTLNELARYLA